MDKNNDNVIPDVLILFIYSLQYVIFHNYTIYIIFNVITYNCFIQILISNINSLFSVTNTKCRPSISCHSLKKKKLDIVDLHCCNCCHLLSDLPSKFQSLMTILHYINVKRLNIPKVVIFYIWHVKEVKVSWDANIGKVIQ